MPISRIVASRRALSALITLMAVFALPPPLGAATRSLPGFAYVSPVPGSRLVSPQTNLILRFVTPMSAQSDEVASALSVTGSRSGTHPGRVQWAEGNTTLRFTPDREFAPGENVVVELGPPVTAAPLAFSFTVSPARSSLSFSSLDSELGDRPRVRSATPAVPFTDDSLPPDFPSITTHTYAPPTPGALFLSNVSFGPPNTTYLLILDNAGGPIFYRQMRTSCFDFKMQPNGLMTYMDLAGGKFYAMDETYAVVDSFACGNGYTTDIHELRLLPNGHALLMAYDTQIVDMSAIVPGGNPAAQVVGLIVQEVDDQQNVYFQWRSWDHYQITDATHEDLTAPVIDYVHGNAIEVDNDGNLLISCRHLDEITKIDRLTGDIVWRWGGLHNEFTMLGDTLSFSHQHAIRRLANGHLTLYDNGNFHSPPFSRAVEYDMDEQARTATTVWEYRGSPDVYGLAMGYVQRLDNGNTLISWGAGKPDIREVAPDGTALMDVTMPDEIFTYRAYRYLPDWLLDAPAPGAQAAASLSGLAPNPTRGRGRVTLTLAHEARVSAGIYDLSGRRILRLLDHASFPAGTHPIEFDLAGRQPGLYFLKLSHAGETETRKVLLVH